MGLLGRSHRNGLRPLTNTKNGLPLTPPTCKVRKEVGIKTGSKRESKAVHTRPDNHRRIIMADFQQQCLEAHNDYRKMHGAPPMTLSSELNDSAQKWADHLLSLGVLQHSKTDNGENVYSSFGDSSVTAKKAVDSWYSEVSKYDFGNPGFNGSTGHFTQVVWKESTQLGVGYAAAGTRVYVVGQYKPAGNMNMPGYFEKNVLPKGGGGTGSAGNSGQGSGGSRKKSCILL